ncbi:MAG: pyruvate kinase [Patescibacteria group bacterium]
MFKIIVTLGPSILKGDTLKMLPREHPYIFRLNGSHISYNYARDLVKKIRKAVKEAVILLDLPGNKVRTTNLERPINLMVGKKFCLTDDMINHKIFFDRVKVGDVIRAHDSLLKFEVINKKKKSVSFISHSNGILNKNKGLHLCGLTDGIDFLTEQDKVLLEIAKNLRIDCVGVSYVRDKQDILLIRDYMRKKDFIPDIFVKIETKRAIENLNSIFSEANNFILDRGDLSSEVGIENISLFQRKIIVEAKKKNRNLFLATQFLKSMIHNPLPFIAEVNDLHNVLADGISGLQLSDETAIGKYPLEAINTIIAIRKNIEKLL